MSSVTVAIIGGGITGLSAAWYLQTAAASAGHALRYTVLEQSGRWGGKIWTEQIAGPAGVPFVIEGGPDSVLTQKPWALQLARELGLAERLLATNEAMRRVFVLNRGQPTLLPDGLMLIVPTKLTPFLRSPLLSPLAKLRMGLDLIIPARRDGQDETLAAFVRRRLGAEALDKIAEPLLAGIYNAEAERQSLLATFPRFRELEEKHGSLIRGMLAARRASQGAPAAPGSARPASMFVSFQAGMGELVETLVSRLTGELCLATGVERLSRAAEQGYRLELSDGRQLTADAVLLTTPASVAATLLREVTPAVATQLATIRYVGTGTVSLAYPRAAIAHPLDGFGLVIPPSERRAINAITWTSTKFAHRAPDNHVLVRVFFGGSRTPAMMALDDDQLLTTVRAELQSIMGITATPVLQRIFRWPAANPQYDVGHLDLVSTIEAALPPGLHLAGSAYRGIGIPDCVHQAQQAAAEIMTALATPVPDLAPRLGADD